MWKGPWKHKYVSERRSKGPQRIYYEFNEVKSTATIPKKKKNPKLGNQFFFLSHALGGKCVSLFGQNQENQYPLYVGNGLPTVNM